MQPQPSTSKQNELRPFHYPLPSPSPTTIKENAENPELVEKIDIPLPEGIINDNITIEDSDWSPPPVVYRTINHKQRYSTQFSDIEEECCQCGLTKRKSWPGSNGQDKQ